MIDGCDREAKERYNVTLVATEVAPYCEITDSAQVVTRLARAFLEDYHNVGRVCIVTPMNRILAGGLSSSNMEPSSVERLTEHFCGREETFELLRYESPAVQTFLDRKIELIAIQHPSHIPPDAHPYSNPGVSPKEQGARHAAFCKAAARAASEGRFRGDGKNIIHNHDYPCAMVAPILALDPSWTKSGGAIVQTIYGIGSAETRGAGPGEYGREVCDIAGLSHLFHRRRPSLSLEFHGGISFLKAGIAYSDAINCLSESYAKEVLAAPQGAGLEGLFKEAAGEKRIFGIMAGMDPDQGRHMLNDFDSLIVPCRTYASFTDQYTGVIKPEEIKAKKIDNRKELNYLLMLNGRNGLVDPNKPTLAIMGPLTEQNVGLITRGDTQALERILILGLHSLPANIIVFGDCAINSPEYHTLKLIEEKILQNFLWINSDKRLDIRNNKGDPVRPFETEQLVYAASDFCLVPATSQPTGIRLMTAMQMGSIPIATAIGAALDLVKDIDDGHHHPNGFLIDPLTERGVVRTVSRALSRALPESDIRTILIDSCLRANKSWKIRAFEYYRMYDQALENARGRDRVW